MMKAIPNETTKQLNEWARANAKSTGHTVAEVKELRTRMAIEKIKKQIGREEADDGGRHMRTVINLGMGADSVGILSRYFDDGFEAHGIDPKRCVVITAQTGAEYPDLATKIDEHIAPRMKAAGIRWVQVARDVDAPGSTTTYKLLRDTDLGDDYVTQIGGSFPIFKEYVDGGTIPQSGGDRLCSIKAKGYALDAWIRKHIPTDEPFRHVIGFDATELGRAFKDIHCGDDNRRPCYPLIEWGWDRAKVIGYIAGSLGIDIVWPKSCCYGCPFAGQGVEKKITAERWAQYPKLAAEVLMMEATAQALNERQTLFGGRKPGDKWDRGSAISFAEKYELGAALAAYAEAFHGSRWAIYRVRRVWTSNTRASRSVEIVDSGDRVEMISKLSDMAAVDGLDFTPVGAGHQVARVIIAPKPTEFPGTQHEIVAAPMTMKRGKTSLNGRQVDTADFDAEFIANGGAPTNLSR